MEKEQSQEPRAKSQEPRAKSQEPRAKSQEPNRKKETELMALKFLPKGKNSYGRGSPPSGEAHLIKVEADRGRTTRFASGVIKPCPYKYWINLNSKQSVTVEFNYHGLTLSLEN